MFKFYFSKQKISFLTLGGIISEGLYNKSISLIIILGYLRLELTIRKI